MHLTLRQLKIFETVVEQGGVTAAARTLHCTQPAVSIQLKQIVDQIGLPLFDHPRDAIRLTEAGEALLAAARTMTDTWDDLEARIGDLKGLKTGRLRIGVVSTAKYFIPRLLGPFCKQYPGIDIHIEVANRAGIVQRLRQGLDDITVMSRPPEDIALDTLTFMDNPLVLIGPPDHPLQRRLPVKLADLAKERILLREPGSGTRIAIDAFLKARKIELKASIEISSNEAIKEAVVGGLGLSILSRHALRDSHGVVELACEQMPIPSSWKIVTLQDKRMTLIGERFIDYLTHEGMERLQQI
jgi:DNA-binding transcriptional LysR family regulator